MSRKDIIQVPLTREPQLKASIERITAERKLSKADVARDLMRRGLRDYEAEQAILRQHQRVARPAV